MLMKVWECMRGVKRVFESPAVPVMAMIVAAVEEVPRMNCVKMEATESD